MGKIGFYIINYKKFNVYLNKVKGVYFLYSQGKIIEWFVIESSALEFCEEYFDDFKFY
ncbi:MAG: hypothetical protein ABF289_14440 [Clostridiales bacterium]